MFGVDFYPTPRELGWYVASKFKRIIYPVLDPSAGKGDLLDSVREYLRFGLHNAVVDNKFDSSTAYRIIENKYPTRHYNNDNTNKNYWAIEIDSSLQSVLRENNYKVIGTDFLNFDGMDQPSTIVMNPPFSNCEDHLLRAIEYLFSGEIVAIISASCIKNPFSEKRKQLISVLNDMKAEIEFVTESFSDAERKTDVEIAIIHIIKEQNVCGDIFKEMSVTEETFKSLPDKDYELTSSDRIKATVARYNSQKRRGVETIINFYKNINQHAIPFLELKQRNLETTTYTNISLNDLLREQCNVYVENLRHQTWFKLMDDPELSKYLTSDKKKDYRQKIERYSYMDVTEHNIRMFAVEISSNYQNTLKDSILKLFDQMTHESAYYPECNKNKLHFNGWKNNNAFKVNKKVVLPRFRFYDELFKQWRKSLWELVEKINDIESVMVYFNGGQHPEKSMSSIIEDNISKGVTSKIETEFFIVSVYKKGTMHLTFKDENIRRRFNIFVCAQKNWLPHDYGTKEKNVMDEEELKVVKNFEETNYKVDKFYNPYGSIQSTPFKQLVNK